MKEKPAALHWVETESVMEGREEELHTQSSRAFKASQFSRHCLMIGSFDI